MIRLFQGSGIAKAPAKIIKVKDDARMLGALGAD